MPAGARTPDDVGRLIFNDRLDAAVAGFFLVAVVVILVASAHEWWLVLRRGKPAVSTEVPWTAAGAPGRAAGAAVAGD